MGIVLPDGLIASDTGMIDEVNGAADAYDGV